MRRKVRECLERSGHPRPGSRILVAMSGGKDSLATAYGLSALSEEYGWEVEGAHVVVRVDGREVGAWDVVRAQARRLGIEVTRLEPEKDVMRAREEMRARKVCYACRTLRRIELGRLAEERGFDYIALGHTLDDAAATVLLSLLSGYRRIKLLGYVGSWRRGPRLLRPLVRCPEEVTRALPERLGVRVVSTEEVCPFAGEGLREEVRRFLDRVERRIPTVKGNVVGTASRTLADRGR